MGKKTKSKQRLDKFYNMAKEQGYRSRAAFKLIQLNRKYNFLSNCNVLVDLCAAPGGWLQVASTVMPMSSVIIGLDLVSIRPIPNCRTFQQDITAPGCVQLLKKELKGQQADVFLCDGAPNVGASWVKDAFSQNDLVLSSLKLAAQFLVKGGLFITKVFRSQDYNSLIWVFNKFFEKVEATKPSASRFVSAEIFVVCHGFQAPGFIDEKLFDSKYVFKDSEADLAQIQQQKEINSVAKLLENRRSRQGYADDVPQTIYRTLEFDEFMKTANPYPLFLSHNKIHLSEEDKKKYIALAKPPQDLDELLADIRVLGKREVLSLIKWKSKLKHQFQKLKSKVDGEEVDENLEDLNDEEEDIEDEEELEMEEEEKEEQRESEPEVYDDLIEMQKELLNKETEADHRQKLNELRKKREKRIKQENRLQSGGLGMGIDSDEELFNKKRHSSKLKKVGFIEVEEEIEGKEQNKLNFQNVDELDRNLELIYEQRKNQNLTRQQREREKKYERKLKNKEGLRRDLDDDHLATEVQRKKIKLNHHQTKGLDQTLHHKFFDKEIFSDIKEQIHTQGNETFENPLKSLMKNTTAAEKKKQQPEKKKKTQINDGSDDENGQPRNKQLQKVQKQVQNDLDDISDIDELIKQQKEMEEEFSDEEEKIKKYKLNVPMSEMEKRRKRMKKKRERDEKENKDKDNDDPNKGTFEIVAAPKLTLDDYDIDGLAFNRALAKKMLRKKTRDTIIDSSFNRHTVEDDDEDLPGWFKDDEDKHCYKINPITKEEFQMEKQKLMSINARVPKKVMEYKIRKWKKTQKKMKKAAQKAQTIFDQEGINDRLKMKQVQKVYKKEHQELDKDKEKKYIVSKRGVTGSKTNFLIKIKKEGGNKNSRHVKFVDKRLKKDKRAQKVQASRIVRSSKTAKSNKKKRQTKRHKAKKLPT